MRKKIGRIISVSFAVILLALSLFFTPTTHVMADDPSTDTPIGQGGNPN